MKRQDRQSVRLLCYNTYRRGRKTHTWHYNTMPSDPCTDTHKRMHTHSDLPIMPIIAKRPLLSSCLRKFVRVHQVGACEPGRPLVPLQRLPCAVQHVCDMNLHLQMHTHLVLGDEKSLRGVPLLGSDHRRVRGLASCARACVCVLVFVTVCLMHACTCIVYICH